jgi:hypothetical protein
MASESNRDISTSKYTNQTNTYRVCDKDILADESPNE